MIRTDFRNYGEIREYIGKFITRNTTLEKKCQYCGKPAEIKYNFKNPYEIQLICRDCKHKRDIYKKYRSVMVPDLSTINILDYVTEKKKYKDSKNLLSEENKLIVEKLLTTDLLKKEAIKEYCKTPYTYSKLVTMYKENYDKDVEVKLKANFKKNQTNAIKRWTNKNSLGKCKNNLAKLKLEHNLSNRDIEEISNHKLLYSSISAISTGKIDPKMRTKCLIAEIFNVSVADVFPKNWLYKSVYHYKDYIDLNQKYRTKLLNIINEKKKCHEKYIILHISEKCNLSYNVIYDFITGTSLNHENLVNIVSNIDNLL